jgi:hypothetical protein
MACRWVYATETIYSIGAQREAVEENLGNTPDAVAFSPQFQVLTNHRGAADLVYGMMWIPWFERGDRDLQSGFFSLQMP